MSAFRNEQIKKLSIEGVSIITLDVCLDSRGIVYEAIHGSDSFVNQIRQVYHVIDPRADTVRAFHVHANLHDWFHIVNGSAIFGLVDDRKGGSSYQKAEKIVLTARKPQLLVVPPGVYHGWMSLESNTIMTSVASEEYCREKPDEKRVPPDHFDALFGGSPWRVDAK
jgi:dTDP-4-dehydrorhamnose 3,5-epimerase